MKLKSTKLLFTSIIIILISVLLAHFWQDLGLDRRHSPALGVALLTSFAINIGGAFIGAKERTIDHKKATRTMLGHLFLAIGFIILVTYSILTT